MAKRLAVILAVFAVSRVFAADLAETYAPWGRLIFTNFASAPFPHPLRANGHQYKDKFFSARDHYEDSHVALFVPKDFEPGPTTDFVVHFHGWGNNASNALGRYHLVEQFAESRRNAILIVPQGPFEASDSFGGKLEDAGGFSRFMDEAMDTLRRGGVITDSQIGKIILSGHSGGYEVISAILAGGGLTDHVHEVWLFDALYAKTERFALWFDHHPGRFIDLYTAHGGTKEETEALMTALQGSGVPFLAADETNASNVDLRDDHLAFLFSELPHDEVMQKRETFRRFLETSSLGACGKKSVRSIDFRNAPEAAELAARAREIGNDVYPRIRELLGDGVSKLPSQLDIIFREHLKLPASISRGEPRGYACRKTVFLNAGWLCEHPDDLDAVLVHEMAHVAQDYPHMGSRFLWQWYGQYLEFKLTHPFQTYPHGPPTCWTEGFAEYVCAKLHYTNFRDCPQCDEQYPHYKDGYTCAAAFLLYLDDTFGTNVTHELNAALRRGSYSESYFARATGKPLDQLWADFQKMRAFRPVAADYNELRQALGYDDGRAPQDIQRRLNAYLSTHADAASFDNAFFASRGNPPDRIQDYLETFLYIRRQPGGEQALRTAETAANELNAIIAHTDGSATNDFRARFKAFAERHPDIGEFAAQHQFLESGPPAEIRNWVKGYLLMRLTPGGKITIAAENSLTKLKNQGRLPGWPRTEHGMVACKPVESDPRSYPARRTFECHKGSETKTLNYTLARETARGNWKLQRAWETSAKGRILREFPITLLEEASQHGPSAF